LGPIGTPYKNDKKNVFFIDFLVKNGVQSRGQEQAGFPEDTGMQKPLKINEKHILINIGKNECFYWFLDPLCIYFLRQRGIA